MNQLVANQAATEFPLEAIRARFPILQQQINGHPLAYLDNGASTQKPDSVIDCVADYYRQDHANVHRGVHELSQRATQRYEAARETVKSFVNAAATEEIIFTSGTTEAINLVANSLVRARYQPGDEVVVSMLEHHSNIVPWQLLADELGLVLRVAPIDEHGNLVYSEYQALLNDNTRLVAITELSNALGTITPLQRIIDDAHAVGSLVLVDGAQAIAHKPVDVQALDCDFYAFSSHKIFGPTGVGVLYGKRGLLEAMPPWKGGGDMIKVVSFSGTEFNDLPYKFEAGTPNIAGVIGLATALDFVTGIGLSEIAAHEQALLDYATSEMQQIEGLRVIGTAAQKAGILSFVIDGVHAADLGTLLDHQGVAIRVGHHCAMPVMEHFGLDATARASLAMYNNRADIDALAAATRKAVAMLR